MALPTEPGGVELNAGADSTTPTAVQTLTAPAGYLSEKQTAAVLGVKPATLRVWAAMKKGPPRVTVGRRPLYREVALYSWLERQERDFDAARATQPRRGAPKRAA